MTAVTGVNTRNISGDAPRSTWSFMTNHTHVLLCIARDPTLRLRDVADMVGLTERAAQSIVADLANDGYLSRSRVGRRNTYEIHLDTALRPHDNPTLTVGGLLEFLQSASRTVRYSAGRPTLQPNGISHN